LKAYIDSRLYLFLGFIFFDRFDGFCVPQKPLLPPLCGMASGGAMKPDAVVMAVKIVAYKGSVEVAVIDVEADSHVTYIDVRNALFTMPGLTRIEISKKLSSRTAVYVPEENALFPVWRKIDG
jgi:hypothetical protein